MSKEEQREKAIQSLERSFNKCRKAGLQFFGVDDTICWSTTARSVPEVVEEYNFSDTGRKVVNTHGTYLDSGGT